MNNIIKNYVISLESTQLDYSKTQENILKPLETELAEKLQEEYQRGYSAGMASAQIEKDEAYILLRQKLETMIQSITTKISEYSSHLHDEIADIVLHVFSYFLLGHLPKREQVLQEINHLLSKLQQQQEVDLVMHPQDIVFLQEQANSLSFIKTKKLNIRADTNLIPGDFLIQTQHGLFDGSLESRLSRLKETLIEIKKRGGYGPLFQ